MLAIPLITLQALIEVAVGGFLAMLVADLTRLVTRGFLLSTGIVLVLTGILGLGGEFALPDPAALTDHPVNRSWLQPSLRLTAVFVVLFMVYLVAIYIRPPLLHVVVGVLTAGAGLASLIAAAHVYPTPAWGAAGTAASYLLSALVVGTVTSAMLLGHWYLVVPNLSTRPLFILLAGITVGLLAQSALLAVGLETLAGHAGVATRHEIVSGAYSPVFWAHVVVGLLLPLLVTALTFQSARLRSLMSVTGLLYVAVVLTLVGQVTGKAILFGGSLPL
ncbi:MAG: hypothetical protein ACYDGR_00585 [Candidatus Dormibacteria bacterium]